MRITANRTALLLVLVGAILTAGVLGFYSVTVSSLRRQAQLQQQRRVEEFAGRLNSYLLVSEQTARSVALLVAPERDRSRVERLLLRTLASTSPIHVYGVGAWFEPYRFSSRIRYFGPYAHRSRAGPPKLVMTYEWCTPAYDFHRQPWYQIGKQGGGTPRFTEPYFDTDYVYMTASQAFFDDKGRFNGVVSVDLILPQLRDIVAQMNRSEHESIFVVTRHGALFAHPEENQLLAWARAHHRQPVSLLDVSAQDLAAFEREHHPHRARVTTTATIPTTGWNVRIATDRATLFSEVSRFQHAVELAVAVFWAACLIGVAGLRRLGHIQAELAARRRVQEELAKSERKLREVLETAVDAVVAFDATGRIVDWNAQAQTLFGWKREEALGRSVGETLFPEWQRHDFDAAQLINRRVELRALHRDIGEFPVEMTLNDIRADGYHLYYAFVADITKRHLVEMERQRLLAQVRQHSAELQALIDHMMESVVACDAEGRISFANKAGLKLLALEASDLGLMRPLEETDIRHWRTWDGRPFNVEDVPIIRALHGETVHDVEVVLFTRHESRRYLRVSAVPIRDAEGRLRAAVAVARDVSEEVEFERMQDEFVKVAAHELKTPITVTKAYADLLLSMPEDLSARQRAMLEAIVRGARRIDRVAIELLDISQLHLGRLKVLKQPLDLGAVVGEALREFAPRHPHHPIRLNVSGTAIVNADRQRLTQVVRELLDNAVTYSPDGGDVDIELQVNEQEAQIAVRDHGIGIPREKQARVFERFYRAHSGTSHDYGGIGVGLYISREMVLRHGGRVWFESEEGRGSTFYIALPLLVPAEAGKVVLHG